jgi:hypothetical protein
VVTESAGVTTAVGPAAAAGSAGALEPQPDAHTTTNASSMITDHRFTFVLLFSEFYNMSAKMVFQSGQFQSG